MKKTLVAYFSPTGTTAAVAKNIAATAESELYEIRPSSPYTKADLNWMDKKCRSSVEMADKSFRPPLADKNANINDFYTVFIGFPIWWYVAPTIINTFLESYDFSNKKIILFATSGGSGFGKTVSNLKGSVSKSADIIEGRMCNGNNSADDLKKWLKSLNLI